MVEAYMGWSIQEKQDEVYEMKHIRNTRWNIHDEVYGKYKWKLNVGQNGWKLDLGKCGWKPNVGKYWWKLNVQKLDEVVRVLGINFKVSQILRNLSFIFIFMFSYICISFFITFLLFYLALTFFPFCVSLYIFLSLVVSVCFSISNIHESRTPYAKVKNTNNARHLWPTTASWRKNSKHNLIFFSLSIIFVFSSLFCMHISVPKHTIHSVFFVYVFMISFSFYMCLSLSTFRSKNFKHNLIFFFGSIISMYICLFFLSTSSPWSTQFIVYSPMSTISFSLYMCLFLFVFSMIF